MKKGKLTGTNNLKYQRGHFMTYILTLLEVIEVRELLSLKIASLKKSRLFLTTVHDSTGSLKADIDLSIQEITDLENVLIYAAV